VVKSTVALLTLLVASDSKPTPDETMLLVGKVGMVCHGHTLYNAQNKPQKPNVFTSLSTPKLHFYYTNNPWDCWIYSNIGSLLGQQTRKDTAYW